MYCPECGDKIRSSEPECWNCDWSGDAGKMLNRPDPDKHVALLIKRKSAGKTGEVLCHVCGGAIRFQWKGNWTKTLHAECVGEEVAWHKWEGGCGWKDVVHSDDSAFKAWNKARQPAPKRDDKHRGFYPR